MKIRSALFAGSWYPARPSECEETIQRFLKDPSITAAAVKNGLGGIVPHAGWFFSGAIACNVIYALSQEGSVDTLLLFGMHLHASSPKYIMTEGAWETPFGAIEIDSELALALTQQFAFKVETADNFTPDNTIELQLPFIKYFLKNTLLVPIGIPPQRDSLDIAKTAIEMANRMGRRIRVLGSTDLTHYGDNYGFTPKGTGEKALEWVVTDNDRNMIETMMAMNPEQVLAVGESRHSACCAGAAASAIAASKELGATRARQITYATSYDKSPGTSFVGYVGIVFEKAA